jgi:hypothetical protein
MPREYRIKELEEAMELFLKVQAAAIVTRLRTSLPVQTTEGEPKGVPEGHLVPK